MSAPTIGNPNRLNCRMPIREKATEKEKPASTWEAGREEGYILVGFVHSVGRVNE